METILWRIIEKSKNKNAIGRGKIEPIGMVETFETEEAARKYFKQQNLSCEVYEIIPIYHDGSDRVRKE